MTGTDQWTIKQVFSLQSIVINTLASSPALKQITCSLPSFRFDSHLKH